MPTKKEFLGELGGTFILIYLGVGAVMTAVSTGAQVGLWQVAVVWGVAVALAIYTFGAASGAHINPAITLAMATYRGFPWRKVPGYVLAQFIGAFIASILLYLQFKGVLEHFELSVGLVRGQSGSELSAMTLANYFPHQGMLKQHGWANEVSGLFTAMSAEFVGTGMLAAFVFALTDPNNGAGPGPKLTPPFIGLAVAALISVLAPLSQACLNPIRDIGPRLVAWLAGWGPMAFPGPYGFFLVYVLSACLGALAGAYLYRIMTCYQPAKN
ncbi:MAG: aquaporin [Deltaproteobacteria bacterium]|nr:aquaporin [Deltaproteobacteria bacterium]